MKPPKLNTEKALELLKKNGFESFSQREKIQLFNLRDEYENTILHLLTLEGQENKIPKEEWTKARIAKRNKYGDTVLHSSANTRRLKFLPNKEAILTETEFLILKNNYGDTVLHRATAYDQLDHINPTLLNRTLLEITNNGGDTILHYAIQSEKSLQHIPPKLITPQALSKKNKHGTSTIGSFAYNCMLHRLPPVCFTIEHLLKETNQQKPLLLVFIVNIKEVRKTQGIAGDNRYKESLKILPRLLKKLSHKQYEEIQNTLGLEKTGRRGKTTENGGTKPNRDIDPCVLKILDEESYQRLISKTIGKDSLELG